MQNPDGEAVSFRQIKALALEELWDEHISLCLHVYTVQLLSIGHTAFSWHISVCVVLEVHAAFSFCLQLSSNSRTKSSAFFTRLSKRWMAILSATARSSIAFSRSSKSFLALLKIISFFTPAFKGAFSWQQSLRPPSTELEQKYVLLIFVVLCMLLSSLDSQSLKK